MGWIVLSKCQIEFHPEHHDEVLAELKKKGQFFYNLDAEDEGNIHFELSGNKSIDYSLLEDLKDYCVKFRIPLKIFCTEFVECEDGYYYNSERG